MATVMIDTLQISRRLRDAGESESIAEALAATFAEQSLVAREELATKADIDAVRREVAALGSGGKADVTAVRGEIAALASATKADIAALASETKADFVVVRKELEALEGRMDNRVLASENRILAGQNRMLIWIGGIAFAAAGFAITLAKAL